MDCEALRMKGRRR